MLTLLLIIALPIAGVETACRAPSSGQTSALPAGSFGIIEEGYQRPTTNSVLSYPEWYIVYAYQDFATVLKTGDEHSFHYLSSISDYWTSLCAVNRLASEQGGSDVNEKVMLYVIGFSFSAEMTIKGTYEDSIGWISALIRGAEKTSEDKLALTVADDYAEFVGQYPWYQYSFLQQVKRLWGQQLTSQPSLARSLERRFALSLEWSVKALYAELIGAGAGTLTTPRAIESVVGGLPEQDLIAIPDVTIVRSISEGKWLIRTPRYDAFTKVMSALIGKGGQIDEIAGNDKVFVTVQVPAGTSDTLGTGRLVFSDAIQSRPGWRRLGAEIVVSALADAVREAQGRGVVIEHIYDY